MAGSITIDGVRIYIPGVYGTARVSSSLEGPARSFHVPVLLADAWQGYPYDLEDKLLTGETARLPTERLGDLTDVRDLYGADSDMAIAFGQGKRVGLPYALCLCTSPLTRASGLVTSTGPVNQFTVYPRLLGAAPGWHKITWTSGGVWTTTPWRNFSPLTANAASGDTRVYVRDNSWAYEGLTVEIGDNDTANAEREIVSVGTEINAAGQKLYWIELDSAVGAAFTTAQYGAVATYQGSRTESSGTLTTGQELVDYLNDESKYWRVVKHANFTSAMPIAVATALPLKDIAAWGTITDGTAPAGSSTDVGNILDWLTDGGNSEIIRVEDLIPRLFLLASENTAAHTLLVTYAAAMREQDAARFPVQLITGCGWGNIDTAANDSDNPAVRALGIDSQDVVLVAGGLDLLAPYLSTAAQVWGLIASGGLVHNLTGDQLKGTPETRWSTSQLEGLIRGGVLTYRMCVTGRGNYLGIAQGCNTLQNNATSWVNGTNETPLVMQRNIVDFVEQDKRLLLMGDVWGADAVDAALVRSKLLARAKSWEATGLIKEATYAIGDVAQNSTGSGWDVTDSYEPPVTTDFINLTTTIKVGGS